MKKKLFAFVSVLLLILALTVPAFAAGGIGRVVDYEDLLTDEEEADLRAKLDEISERQQLDVVVVTTPSLDGKSSMEWADDFYDMNGYGYGAEKDGVILIMSLATRDYWISTCGYGITALTDYGIEQIKGYVQPKLSAGNYYGAFQDFAYLVDDYTTRAKNGEPVDVPQYPTGPDGPAEKSTPGPFAAAGSGLIGFLISLFSVNRMKGQLKTVRPQSGAREYLDRNSVYIRNGRDDFLYTNVTKVPIPHDDEHRGGGGGSSVHISSSGVSHGGGGGKF